MTNNRGLTVLVAGNLPEVVAALRETGAKVVYLAFKRGKLRTPGMVLGTWRSPPQSPRTGRKCYLATWFCRPQDEQNLKEKLPGVDLVVVNVDIMDRLIPMDPAHSDDPQYGQWSGLRLFKILCSRANKPLLWVTRRSSPKMVSNLTIEICGGRIRTESDLAGGIGRDFRRILRRTRGPTTS